MGADLERGSGEGAHRHGCRCCSRLRLRLLLRRYGFAKELVHSSASSCRGKNDEPVAGHNRSAPW